jgi:hypothetical protein
MAKVSDNPATIWTGYNQHTSLQYFDYKNPTTHQKFNLGVAC